MTVAAQMMGLLAGAGAAATSVEAHCSKIFRKHATSCDDRICTVMYCISFSPTVQISNNHDSKLMIV